jgi:hypothetical protein
VCNIFKYGTQRALLFILRANKGLETRQVAFLSMQAAGDRGTWVGRQGGPPSFLQVAALPLPSQPLLPCMGVPSCTLPPAGSLSLSLPP